MIKSPTDLQIFKFVLISFLSWKIILTAIAFIGISVFPISLPNNEIAWAPAEVDFWGRWANWDGGHFRGIAEVGYLPFQTVFFPLYPLLIKALMILNIHSLWAGIVISNLSIVGALFFLYKLVRLDFEEYISRKAVFLTLAFPTAFYFNAVYSESLFLLLTISAFYFARTRIWTLAFMMAGLAAATRLTGLVVIAAIALEYYFKIFNPPTIKQFWEEFLNRIAVYLLVLAFFCSALQKYFLGNQLFLEAEISKLFSFLLVSVSLILFSVFILKFLFKVFEFRKIFSKVTVYLLLSFLPFFGYCYFLYLTQGNFFAFITYEKEWDRYLTLPWNSLIIYLQNIWGNGVFRVGHTHQYLIELLFFIFYLVLLVISYFKLRFSYTFYFALSILIPISTGTFQAIHRYGLVIFPVFIILALIKNETYYNLWMYLSLTLLGIFTVLYINYYWVS